MSEEVWSRCTPRDGTVGRGRDLGLLFPCCNPDALPVKVLWTGGFCELRCRSFCSLWQFPSRFLSSILCEFSRLHSTAPCLSSSYSFSLQALVSSGGSTVTLASGSHICISAAPHPAGFRVIVFASSETQYVFVRLYVFGVDFLLLNCYSTFLKEIWCNF